MENIPSRHEHHVHDPLTDLTFASNPLLFSPSSTQPNVLSGQSPVLPSEIYRSTTPSSASSHSYNPPPFLGSTPSLIGSSIYGPPGSSTSSLASSAPSRSPSWKSGGPYLPDVVSKEQTSLLIKRISDLESENVRLAAQLEERAACLHKIQIAYEQIARNLNTSSNISDPPMELDSEDYPNIGHWDRSSFQKNADIFAGKLPKSSYNHALRYAQKEDGSPPTEKEANEIRKTVQAIFFDLQRMGLIAPTWGQIGLEAKLHYQKALYGQFPLFRLCSHHWKADNVAQDTYPQFIRDHVKKTDPNLEDGSSRSTPFPDISPMKVSVKREAIATVPSTAIPLKRAKSVAASATELARPPTSGPSVLKKSPPHLKRTDKNSSTIVKPAPPSPKAALLDGPITKNRSDSVGTDNSRDSKPSRSPVLNAVLAPLKGLKVVNPLSTKRKANSSSSSKATPTVDPTPGSKQDNVQAGTVDQQPAPLTAGTADDDDVGDYDDDDDDLPPLPPGKAPPPGFTLRHVVYGSHGDHGSQVIPIDVPIEDGEKTADSDMGVEAGTESEVDIAMTNDRTPSQLPVLLERSPSCESLPLTTSLPIVPEDVAPSAENSTRSVACPANKDSNVFTSGSALNESTVQDLPKLRIRIRGGQEETTTRTAPAGSVEDVQAGLVPQKPAPPWRPAKTYTTKNVYGVHWKTQHKTGSAKDLTDDFNAMCQNATKKAFWEHHAKTLSATKAKITAIESNLEYL